MSQTQPKQENKAAPSAKGKRPFILDPLFTRVTALAGVGPKNAKLFERLCGGDMIANLLWHLPVDFIDRRFSPLVKDAPAGKIATLTVTIEKHSPSPKRHLPYRVHCSDDSGSLDLIFFNARKDFLMKQLPPGEKRIVSGKIDIYQGKAQMVHPDTMGPESERENIETVEPIYPLTAGLTNKAVNKAIKGSLERAPDLAEWLDPQWITKNQWTDWETALAQAHAPLSEKGLSANHPARQRLAYDELLANQLTLAIAREKNRKKKGISIKGDTTLREKLISSLPFSLTGAQERSLQDIYADMAAPYRMLRLLQGDVGSGKTVVAALSMLQAVEAGYQAAIMAPTEILARQHAETLIPMLDSIGVKAVILTGRDKGKAREPILEAIESGSAHIVIGTHALFQDDVTFKNLGLGVIDEQHRFGVQQRLRLSKKGQAADILVMTATPIPRTLTLTAYGDMDVSRLDEKPPGRKPIDTRLIPQEKIEGMVDGLSRQIKEGSRIYWVCPLVEESEVLDLKAAQERYEILQAHFGNRVGLVHGQMKGPDKDEVMQNFASGELDILVATTVIEVGVNVPEATIMVIEHAERFGLAQLHQLRGRVGRGSDKSYCFLVYSKRITLTAKERLTTMRDTEDGFVIAEKDLDLRGAGEILGTRQSGIQEFRLATLPAHSELLAAARDDAQLIINKDPKLETERGQALRVLLYLFQSDQAIQNLLSG